MKNHPRLIQVTALLLAAGLLAAAGLVRRPLDDARRDDEILTEADAASSLLEVIPGGLRAPIIAYLWIRVEELKQQERYHEIMQLSDMICRLQPRFPGVWDYHAWNMAYNISVKTHTPEERWLWVNNGVELLRDKGIPYNPKSIILYRQLAWIFNHKMGDFMDEMHMTYKARLAAIFQRLLASPPYGTTRQVIDAFRPVSEAPLDRTRQADDVVPGQRRLIQMDRLEALRRSDAQVGGYLDALARHGVTLSHSHENLLEAYNRFTRDEAVMVIRRALQPASAQDKPLADLINDPKFASARATLLAFVRAQILWNRYRMDPQWMLKVMERYGPVDWRLPWAHALYWTTLGVEKTQGLGRAHIDYLNNDRNVLNALKALTWYGRLTMIENPNNPDQPQIFPFSDVRFIDTCQAEHVRLIDARLATVKTEAYKTNMFADGHINYLASAVQMLFATQQADRLARARELMQFVLDNYGAKNPAWNLPLEDFVYKIFEQDGRPITEVAVSQIDTSIQTALLALLTDQPEIHAGSLAHARKLYDAYMKGVPERLKKFQPELNVVLQGSAENLLVRPRALGYNLSLVDRSRLYLQLDADTRGQIYDFILPPLRQECAAFEADFAKLFPTPPNLEQAREIVRKRIQKAEEFNRTLPR